MADSSPRAGSVDVVAPDLNRAPARGRDDDYQNYRKVLSFIAIWVAAVVVAVFWIKAPDVGHLWEHPGYHTKYGYTFSLVLLFLPLGFLAVWYLRNRDVLQLRPVMRAFLQMVVFTAVGWTLLDIFLANLIFAFPDKHAHIKATLIPGYLWTGNCSTVWNIWRFPDCYRPRSIPLEEVLFYLGGAALLPMMYMWASEDFYSAYTLPRREYEEEAKRTGPLLYWNKTFVLIGITLAVAGIIIKQWGWWHSFHHGLPTYFLAELIIVFVPLSALYTRVHKFTNPQAFVFVMLLHVLVSVVWEATIALPYGWWNYQPASMMGIFVSAWSNLAIEACGLWISVGWASMFVYEATKIKVVTGRTWREVLFG